MRSPANTFLYEIAGFIRKPDWDEYVWYEYGAKYVPGHAECLGRSR
jgi:hypothetical protein